MPEPLKGKHGCVKSQCWIGFWQKQIRSKKTKLPVMGHSAFQHLLIHLYECAMCRWEKPAAGHVANLTANELGPVSVNVGAERPLSPIRLQAPNCHSLTYSSLIMSLMLRRLCIHPSLGYKSGHPNQTPPLKASKSLCSFCKLIAAAGLRRKIRCAKIILFCLVQLFWSNQGK